MLLNLIAEDRQILHKVQVAARNMTKPADFLFTKHIEP